MSGHGDNIKLLIKLNWAFAGIFIIGFMALYYTIIQDTKQYVAYEREQLKNMIITEQMDRADFKKQMDDYMANHKMKYYAKIDNLVPSAFKGYSTKKSK